MSKRLQDLTPITSTTDSASVLIVNSTATNLLTISNLRTTVLTPASSNTLGAVKVGENLSVAQDGTLSAPSLSLPAQAGQSGKFLTTNGTTTSWGTITVPTPIPSIAGNSGKFLTNNGQNLTWTPIPTYEALPAKTNNSGKFLTNNGTTLSWASLSDAPVVFKSYSTTARDQLTPVAGMVLFNTTVGKLQVYTGSAWADLN